MRTSWQLVITFFLPIIDAQPSPPLSDLPRYSANLFPLPYNDVCGAAKCIDSDYNTELGCVEGTSLCSTQDGILNPRLEIDMNAPYFVDHMKLYNRIDCCKDRLGNWELWVHNETFHYTFGKKCASGNAPANATLVEQYCGAFGRYATLVLPGPDRTLNIQELYLQTFSPLPPPPSPQPSSSTPYVITGVVSIVLACLTVVFALWFLARSIGGRGKAAQ